jgi:hypothetical protein
MVTSAIAARLAHFSRLLMIRTVSHTQQAANAMTETGSTMATPYFSRAKVEAAIGG